MQGKQSPSHPEALIWLFQIDATTGALTFQLLQIMKVSSVSGTNDYLVEITLTDDNAPTPATSLSILALTVQITDVNDTHLLPLHPQ